MVLETDQGIRHLDEVLEKAISSNDKSSILELTSFFSRKSPELIPFHSEKLFQSEVQFKMSQWIDVRYRSFVKYLTDNMIPYFKEIEELLIRDDLKLLATYAAKSYINGFPESNAVLSIPEVQKEIYNNADVDSPKAFEVLMTQPPNPVACEEFSKFFMRMVEKHNTIEDTEKILTSFDAIVGRFDDRLVPFDYLNAQLHAQTSISVLAIPHIVNVSISKAVDIKDFYELTFKALTPESISRANRKQLFDTLSRVITPIGIPASVSTAFAVKLSRMIPSVPFPVQMDILSLIQFLVRAHDCVAELLKPIDAPVSPVYGELSDCKPQTLWEVRACVNHPVPHIAEIARSLGQRFLPPDFGSFDIHSITGCIKKEDEHGALAANWVRDLDFDFWSK